MEVFVKIWDEITRDFQIREFDAEEIIRDFSLSSIDVPASLNIQYVKTSSNTKEKGIGAAMNILSLK